MRPVAAILLFLVLGLRAFFPNLPSYVCLGMGGKHLERPCCPAEAPTPGAPSADATLRARCCQNAPPLALETGPQPPRPLPLDGPDRLVAVVPAGPPTCSTRDALRSVRLSGRAPPVGLPPPLRPILRI